MKIFTNKIPRRWRSSGAVAKFEQIEMSNFSFIEESFTSSSKDLEIIIIGKNIIGNGGFSVSIYNGQLFVLQEEFSFDGVSYSKKKIRVENCNDEEFKIIISRGKKSKGKILINEVSIYEDAKTKETKEIVPVIKVNEIIPSPPEPSPPTLKKSIRRIRYKKKEEDSKHKDIPIEELPAIKEEPSIAEISPVIITPIEKVVTEVQDIIPTKNDTHVSWITVIDFSQCNDERSIFNYLNQISFGRDKQIFFVKQSIEAPVDFSKYSHVKIFFEDSEILLAIKEAPPKKLTFIKNNLNGFFLEEIEKIKSEISK